MNKALKQWVTNWASLKITVICLVVLILLVFAGTLSQVNLGIYESQKKYFQSFFVLLQLKNGWQIPFFPGGYLIGFILILNLIAATGLRFKYWLKHHWLFLSHMGVLLLLVGGGFSYAFSVESQMSIAEGEAKYYSEDFRLSELAIIDHSKLDRDRVTIVPEHILKSDAIIASPQLPFEIKVRAYLGNADLSMGADGLEYYELPQVSHGIGQKIKVSPKAMNRSGDATNLTTVFAEIIKDEDSLGVWLFSLGLGAAQNIEVDGMGYEMSLRPKRYYNDYQVKLVDFKHDVYPGTEIPMNYSSDIILTDASMGEDRDVHIYMNNPLRYRGKTYFQASFANNDTVSIFQVVQNPSWLIPYIACTMMSIGLTMHFLLKLLAYTRRRNQ
ncbi:MAG: hypothetical protein ACI9CF_000417 [Candidatus Omnitrophota bacterium]